MGGLESPDCVLSVEKRGGGVGGGDWAFSEAGKGFEDREVTIYQEV